MRRAVRGKKGHAVRGRMGHAVSGMKVIIIFVCRANHIINL